MTTSPKPPPPTAGQQFNDESWDRARCLDEFCAAIAAGNSQHTIACMRAMDRLGCWRAAFEQLISGPSAGQVSGERALNLWTEHGFHVADGLNGDPILATVLKSLLPPYTGPGLVLFRGEAVERYQRRAYGMSWTPDLRVAQMFAHRRDPRGVVLKLCASSEMIFCEPSAHSVYLQEYEYLIDPLLVADVEVVG